MVGIAAVFCPVRITAVVLDLQGQAPSLSLGLKDSTQGYVFGGEDKKAFNIAVCTPRRGLL